MDVALVVGGGSWLGAHKFIGKLLNEADGVKLGKTFRVCCFFLGAKLNFNLISVLFFLPSRWHNNNNFNLLQRLCANNFNIQLQKTNKICYSSGPHPEIFFTKRNRQKCNITSEFIAP